MSDKIESLTDTIYSTFTQKASSGKISDLIIAFKEVNNILKVELEKAYKNGYEAAKNELKIKQQKEN